MKIQLGFRTRCLLMNLENEFIAKLSIPLEEGNLLVIEDALKNIDEDKLIGQDLLKSHNQ